MNEGVRYSRQDRPARVITRKRDESCSFGKKRLRGNERKNEARNGNAISGQIPLAARDLVTTQIRKCPNTALNNPCL